MFILAVWWGWEFASNGGFNDDPSSKKEEWKTGGTKRCEQVPLHKCGFGRHLPGSFQPSRVAELDLTKGTRVGRHSAAAQPSKETPEGGRECGWVG